MSKLLLTLILTTAFVATPPDADGQKKQSQCEQASATERNWELIGQQYVYFDYVLCPPGMNPPSPLVRIWITTNGDGIGVEKWSKDREGADVVSMFNGKKKAYTLYRDLNAVPASVFKLERRSGVAAEIASKPFLAQGTMLVPFENLTPDSAKRAQKVFESADLLIQTAQKKASLLHEAGPIGVIVESLSSPLKAQD